MKNGFKLLEEEALRNVPPPPPNAQEKIIGQLGNYRTWTAIIDHFVSAPIQLIQRMMDKEEGTPLPLDGETRRRPHTQE